MVSKVVGRRFCDMVCIVLQDIRITVIKIWYKLASNTYCCVRLLWPPQLNTCNNLPSFSGRRPCFLDYWLLE